MASYNKTNQENNNHILGQTVQEHSHTSHSHSHHQHGMRTNHLSSGSHRHHHHEDSSDRFKNRSLLTAKRRKLIEKYLFRFTCLLALIVVLTCLFVYFFNPQ
jgi:ABC-type nickel/cobalt efflux system permease component RcnA